MLDISDISSSGTQAISSIKSRGDVSGGDDNDEPTTPPDTAIQERILNGDDEDDLNHVNKMNRPMVGGLRLRERLYRSKSTIRLSDFDFSLNMCPFVTVETPFSLERIVHWLALQETANPSNELGTIDETSEDNDNAAEVGGPEQIEGGGGVDNQENGHGDIVSGNGDDSERQSVAVGARRKNENSESNRERKRLKKLKDRYSRWFGPYVATATTANNNGGGGGSNSGGGAS